MDFIPILFVCVSLKKKVISLASASSKEKMKYIEIIFLSNFKCKSQPQKSYSICWKQLKDALRCKESNLWTKTFYFYRIYFIIILRMKFRNFWLSLPSIFLGKTMTSFFLYYIWEYCRPIQGASPQCVHTATNIMFSISLFKWCTIGMRKTYKMEDIFDNNSNSKRKYIKIRIKCFTQSIFIAFCIFFSSAHFTNT